MSLGHTSAGNELLPFPVRILFYVMTQYNRPMWAYFGGRDPEEIDDQLMNEVIDSGRISLNDYIRDKWSERFPDKKDLDIELIKRLASQSKGLKFWYLQVISNYNSSVEIPDVLKDAVTVKEYDEVKAKIVEINADLKKKQQEIQKLAMQYKSEVRKLEEKYNNIEVQRMNDPLLFCLTITSEDLPLKTRLKLEQYTPEKEDMTRKQLGKQELLLYKRELIKILKDGKNPIQYCDENSTKF